MAGFIDVLLRVRGPDISDRQGERLASSAAELAAAIAEQIKRLCGTGRLRRSC